MVTRERAQGRRELEDRPSVGTSIIVPASPGLVPAQIDKSVLAIAEPKRLRDKAHLRFVASQPCLVCGRQPSDPHHLRFAQPRALGLKVSDEFTVPLCRGHPPHTGQLETSLQVAGPNLQSSDCQQYGSPLWSGLRRNRPHHRDPAPLRNRQPSPSPLERVKNGRRRCRWVSPIFAIFLVDANYRYMR